MDDIKKVAQAIETAHLAMALQKRTADQYFEALARAAIDAMNRIPKAVN